MPTENTPDPMPEKPRNNHQFETPVVRETRSCGLAPEEPHPGPGADAEREPPPQQQMAFERRWQKVQAVFVARGRRGLRPV